MNQVQLLVFDPIQVDDVINICDIDRWLHIDNGVQNRGGGATIRLYDGDTREVRIARGSLCSTTRTELFALRVALE